jgi:hypothetical protein
MTAPYLVLNGQSLSIPGFCGTKDITGLMAPAPMRDVEDFESDGIDGATFIPKPRGPLVTGASFLVSGRNTSAGVPHADPWVGVRDNRETIAAAVISPTALVTAVMHYGDASTRSGQIYVPRLIPSPIQEDDATGAAQVIVLEIVCPAGAFT